VVSKAKGTVYSSGLLLRDGSSMGSLEFLDIEVLVQIQKMGAKLKSAQKKGCIWAIAL
jgi:hypothetical protein